MPASPDGPHHPKSHLQGVKTNTPQRGLRVATVQPRRSRDHDLLLWRTRHPATRGSRPVRAFPPPPDDYQHPNCSSMIRSCVRCGGVGAVSADTDLPRGQATAASDDQPRPSDRPRQPTTAQCQPTVGHRIQHQAHRLLPRDAARLAAAGHWGMARGVLLHRAQPQQRRPPRPAAMDAGQRHHPEHGPPTATMQKGSHPTPHACVGPSPRNRHGQNPGKISPTNTRKTVDLNTRRDYTRSRAQRQQHPSRPVQTVTNTRRPGKTCNGKEDHR